MVRGTKRKIPIEKITKRTSLATCFTKRISGLYSKASQLCLLSDTQIAILATPSSSQSNVSFYSFGHSSVDSVVSAFLAGKPPLPSENKNMRTDVGICLTRKDLGLGLWWDDERLLRSENPEEIKEAMDSMSSLLTKLRSVHEDLTKNETQSLNQTLDRHSSSEICCVPDVCLNKDKEIVSVDDDLKNSEEHDQIMVISDSFCITDNNNNNLYELIDFGKNDEDNLSFSDVFNGL